MQNSISKRLYDLGMDGSEVQQQETVRSGAESMSGCIR